MSSASNVPNTDPPDVTPIEPLPTELTPEEIASVAGGVPRIPGIPIPTCPG